MRTYHEEVRASTPVGAFINDQWSNNVFGYCGEDNREARELCAQSMKTFFGPDKPYIAGRTGAYEELLEDRLAYGRPDTVVSKLKYLVEEFQLDGVIMEPNVGGGVSADRMLNSIRLYAEEVAPRLR